MRVLRFLGYGVLTIVVLLAVTIVALWFYSPFAPAVVMSDPLPTGRRITDDGLLANYFPGAGPGKHAGILLLGGSEGGLGAGVTHMAKDLQAHGYSVLQVSYFRGPGQSDRLELVPLELFDRAIVWLKSQAEVDGERLAVVGGSKGAEAALIVAARHPELRAAVAGMPSNVAWQGLDWNILKQIAMPPNGSWSLDGKPIPYVHYVKAFKKTLVEFYTASLLRFPPDSDAVIHIELSHASVLLVCGKQDTLWPSCLMADRVKARATEKGGPAVTVLAYDNAGHGVFGIPADKSNPNYTQLHTLGGTDDGINAARADSWPKALAHLEGALKP